MAFIDVVHFGSFNEAAKHRDMPASLLSRNIKQLEKNLGLTLFNRTTRSVSLTDAGKDIYHLALQARDLEQQINQSAQNRNHVQGGHVKLTCAAHLSERIVLPAIAQVRQRYSNITFEVDYDDRRVDMIKEGFDLALRVWKPEDTTLIGQKLSDSRLMVVASPAFLKQHGQPDTLQQLASLPAACYARHGLVRDTLRYYQNDQLLSLKLNIGYRSSSADSLVQSAKAGLFYTMVTNHNLGDAISRGELVALFSHIDFAAEDPVYAIYPNRDLSFAARQLLEAIKQAFTASNA
ncbi:LysR family transcriptional regulator [Oceanimonas sp. MB9]|uniref:LysR family transcriptional regulator n=1 Tax=Oceanimonas sp. MB9 TaxID=2588453 RepID=UPI0013F68753|nr:LysR family transcriptional regulator [Oceanimonas sp. MB9]